MVRVSRRKLGAASRPIREDARAVADGGRVVAGGIQCRPVHATIESQCLDRRNAGSAAHADKTAVGLDSHFPLRDALESAGAQPFDGRIMQCAVLLLPRNNRLVKLEAWMVISS